LVKRPPCTALSGSFPSLAGTHFTFVALKNFTIRQNRSSSVEVVTTHLNGIRKMLKAVRRYITKFPSIVVLSDH
jgi:hypothetical protein